MFMADEFSSIIRFFLVANRAEIRAEQQKMYGFNMLKGLACRGADLIMQLKVFLEIDWNIKNYN